MSRDTTFRLVLLLWVMAIAGACGKGDKEQCVVTGPGRHHDVTPTAGACRLSHLIDDIRRGRG